MSSAIETQTYTAKMRHTPLCYRAPDALQFLLQLGLEFLHCGVSQQGMSRPLTSGGLGTARREAPCATQNKGAGNAKAHDYSFEIHLCCGTFGFGCQTAGLDGARLGPALTACERCANGNITLEADGDVLESIGTP